MSHLTYQNSLTCNILPTLSTHHLSSHTSLTMMRSFQLEACTNLAQLNVIDGTLDKSYNLDSNLEPGNCNMKLNAKIMMTSTIAVSIQPILMSSCKQTTGFMVINQILIRSENQANPQKQDIKDKENSDKSMKTD